MFGKVSGHCIIGPTDAISVFSSMPCMAAIIGSTFLVIDWSSKRTDAPTAKLLDLRHQSREVRLLAAVPHLLQFGINGHRNIGGGQQRWWRRAGEADIKRIVRLSPRYLARAGDIGSGSYLLLQHAALVHHGNQARDAMLRSCVPAPVLGSLSHVAETVDGAD
jgi:hypothetical protein